MALPSRELLPTLSDRIPAGILSVRSRRWLRLAAALSGREQEPAGFQLRPSERGGDYHCNERDTETPISFPL